MIRKILLSLIVFLPFLSDSAQANTNSLPFSKDDIQVVSEIPETGNHKMLTSIDYYRWNDKIAANAIENAKSQAVMIGGNFIYINIDNQGEESTAKIEIYAHVLPDIDHFRKVVDSKRRWRVTDIFKKSSNKPKHKVKSVDLDFVVNDISIEDCQVNLVGRLDFNGREKYKLVYLFDDYFYVSKIDKDGVTYTYRVE